MADYSQRSRNTIMERKSNRIGINFGRNKNFGKNVRTNFGRAHRVGICPGVKGIGRPSPYDLLMSIGDPYQTLYTTKPIKFIVLYHKD